MHDDNAIEDFSLGLILFAGLVAALFVVILFYAVAVGTVVVAISAPLWTVARLYRTSRNKPHFLHEIVLYGGISLLCGLTVAGGIWNWLLQVTWTHRPCLPLTTHYLLSLASNGSMAVLLVRAGVVGLNPKIVASTRSTLTRMTIAGAAGYALLAVAVTHEPVRVGMVHVTTLLPLLITLVPSANSHNSTSTLSASADLI